MKHLINQRKYTFLFIRIICLPFLFID
ncbi:unnamed protein product [Medioppia subpectinata]|uniref:Uncharacterized protein n=1 Tax=Medioppia subpectinata TaxID=1979941 RepID=A0A7R9Q6D1_9ACAR|nr:unnamed protein product [Medioppia subpectinata]CAG2114754.1 unnamed protein product [Medioppia subpectinata]